MSVGGEVDQVEKERKENKDMQVCKTEFSDNKAK